MKEKYYLLFLFATGFAMANAQIETYDVFEERSSEVFDPKGAISQENMAVGKDVFLENGGAFGGEDIFENINPVFEQKSGNAGFEEPKTRVVAQQKTLAPASLKVIPTNKDGAMLKINWRDGLNEEEVVRTANLSMLMGYMSSIEVNTTVLNDEMYKTILWLIEYLYFATKQWAPGVRICPGGFDQGKKPPTYENLQASNIKIFAPVFGVNGKQEYAVCGMLAYRIVAPKTLEIFVVCEGSQGEPFEFLGGIGGASWRTNFQSKKVYVDAETLGLDKKYGELCFHEGYLAKSISMKADLESKLEALFKFLKIKRFDEYPVKSGTVTQEEIEKWRGYKVVCRIFGHSQGGGVAGPISLITATKLTEMLFGKNVDIKDLNMFTLLMVSGARFLGNMHTVKVFLETFGLSNILSINSILDIVPRAPLGHNLGKDTRATQILLEGIKKAVNLVVKESKLKDFITTAISTDFGYEDMPVNALVDYTKSCKEYGSSSISELQKHEQKLKKKDEKKAVEKTIKELKEIVKNASKISAIVEPMQENYFKSHVSKKYVPEALYHLRNLMKKIPLGHFIAFNHGGAARLIQNPEGDPNDTKNYRIEKLFNCMVLYGSIQEAVRRGFLYYIWKQATIEMTDSNESSNKIGR